MLAGTVLDLPYQLPDPGAGLLLSALDVEGKITRALQALGPVAGRDVALVGPADGVLAGRLAAADARVEPVAFQDGRLPLDATRPMSWPRRGVPSAAWTRPSSLRPIASSGPAAGCWCCMTTAVTTSRISATRRFPNTPRGAGVTDRSCGAASRSVSSTASGRGRRSTTPRPTLVCFGTPGEELAAALHRPRASWNVAVYHRWRGGEEPGDVVPGGVPLPVRDTRRLEGSVA